MERYILDGENFITKEDAYEYIKSVFDFPDYFGNNLDALWDSLRDLGEVQIVIINAESIRENLEEYGYDILDVFEDLNKFEDVEVEIYD